MSIPLRNVFDQEPKPSNLESSWIKLQAGTYDMRLCPTWDENRVAPYLMVEQHHGFTDSENKKRSPICLGQIMASQELATKMKSLEVITKKDFDLVNKHGCPFCLIANKLISGKFPKDDISKFQVKASYWWNVVVRPRGKDRIYNGIETNKPLMWSRSRQFFDQVRNNLNIYPDLFDEKKGNDFQITATGDGLNRRYTSPIFYPDKRPLNLGKGTSINDLYQAMAYGVKSFEQCVELIASNHTATVKRSGVNLNKLG